ncbi:hypothetical protein VT930_06870 [Mycobacterium sherrisii]|uniref:hypothetical protein n=1 Tax=Mycobacterium sherrisii TaxID=243061 RepID=UPI002DDD1E7E|nr:hypothetical protein [Mycobacterium sherrisii]MEC4762833.1 hypothetical protein [Mycobacterium sherrisii]
MFGIAVLITGTTAYYVAEVRAGFHDIGQGAFGVGFKFIGAYLILPYFVLYATSCPVNHRRAKRALSGAAAPAGCRLRPPPSCRFSASLVGAQV